MMILFKFRFLWMMRQQLHLQLEDTNWDDSRYLELTM